MEKLKDNKAPIDRILTFDGNIHELTSAIIKRADQIAKAGSENLSKFHNKSVTTAIYEVMNGIVKYRYKKED